MELVSPQLGTRLEPGVRSIDTGCHVAVPLGSRVLLDDDVEDPGHRARPAVHDQDFGGDPDGGAVHPGARPRRAANADIRSIALLPGAELTFSWNRLPHVKQGKRIL